MENFEDVILSHILVAITLNQQSNLGDSDYFTSNINLEHYSYNSPNEFTTSGFSFAKEYYLYD